MQELVTNLGILAKNASSKLALLSSEEKNRALAAMADSLEKHRFAIKSANDLDLKLATNLSQALLERLKLSDQGIDSMINGIKEIIRLDDPVAKLITSKILSNGMELKKVRVPMGVIGIIFESRPNVIADVAALCLKSGNAVILRGGKEAEHSNKAIMDAILAGLAKVNFIPEAVQLITVQDRMAVNYLCRLNDYIDLIIPRGGESLIKAVSDCATVPVIKHYKGVCHVYVDDSADLAMALSICHNAKCSRPSVCNAAESIVIHDNIAAEFLPKLVELFHANGVEIRGDELAYALCPSINLAQPIDFSTEYLDLIVSIKIVPNIEQAIKHINKYGSHHSDTIVANSQLSQQAFARQIDSAVVYINASTRFTDGAIFGLGAEMGISTDKLHVRGPMGLNELCTYKWIGIGHGQIRV